MSGAQHTPGPWGWFGNLKSGSPYLATIHSGRRLVMQFGRLGLQGAQPRFHVGGRMIDGTELARFEVGDRNVLGLKAAKADDSVYRYDMIGFDHPDARMLAAAPDMYDALLAAELAVEELCRGQDPANECWNVLRRIQGARAKAEGRA